MTFHVKVKSSGYGSVPPRKLFGADRSGTEGVACACVVQRLHADTNHSVPTAKRRSKSARDLSSASGSLASSSSARGGVGIAAPTYPAEPPPPDAIVHGPTERLHSEPVLRIAYSGDGKHFARCVAAVHGQLSRCVVRSCRWCHPWLQLLHGQHRAHIPTALCPRWPMGSDVSRSHGPHWSSAVRGVDSWEGARHACGGTLVTTELTPRQWGRSIPFSSRPRCHRAIHRAAWALCQL